MSDSIRLSVVLFLLSTAPASAATPAKPGVVSSDPGVGNDTGAGLDGGGGIVVRRPSTLRCGGIDLSNQFPAGPQSQGSVGSCHVFGAIGVVEAAIYRAYGVRIKLSEADLFVRNTVTKSQYYSFTRARRRIGAAPPKFREGNDLVSDLRSILMGGVATNRSVPYHRMLERYEKFSENLAETIDSAQALALKVGGKLSDSTLIGHYQRLAQNPVNVKSWENALNGSSLTINQEREIVRRALRGFRSELFYGDGKKEYLVSNLCTGRPVLVGMNMGWLTGYDDSDRHAIIISGFETTRDGLVFQTRNSWGEDGFIFKENPGIPEQELHRIHSVAVVLTPDENLSAKTTAPRETILQLRTLASQR